MTLFRLFREVYKLLNNIYERGWGWQCQKCQKVKIPYDTTLLALLALTPPRVFRNTLACVLFNSLRNGRVNEVVMDRPAVGNYQFFPKPPDFDHQIDGRLDALAIVQAGPVASVHVPEGEPVLQIAAFEPLRQGSVPELAGLRAAP